MTDRRGRRQCGRPRGSRLGSCFRGEGYRMTAAREAILNVFENSREHLSAEDVYHRVHTNYPRIGLTTVYRNLELLEGIGVLSKFEFGDGRARYELNSGPQGSGDHHHHLICKACGRIINYAEFIDEELDFLKRAEKGLSKKYNFIISDHIIQFMGTCQTCLNRKS